MTRLPKAVQEAAERAQAIHAQLYGNPEAQAEAPEETPQEPEQPVAAPEPEQPPPTSDAPREEDPNYWKQRLSVVQGQHRADVSRLSAENRELKTDLDRLKQDIERIQQAAQQEPLVKPEEIAEYGEPLVDLMRRAAKQELAPVMSKVQEMETKDKKLEEQLVRDRTTRFYSALDQAVPDWEDVNQDPAFLSWLDEIDDISGERRLDILQHAERSLDNQRALAIFTAFKRQSAPKAATRSNALESQVVPSGVRSEAPAVPMKKIWSRSEIKHFYDTAALDAAKPDKKDKRVSEEEFRRVDAEIHAAYAEGRIR